MGGPTSTCGSLSSATGTSVTYTPPLAGTAACTATIVVSTSVNPSVSQTFTVTVDPTLTIVTPSLPSGTYGAAYASTTLTATGGIAPYTWAATGPLPPGLVLSKAGVLSGTATAAVSGTYTFSVTDSTSTAYTTSTGLAITVAPKALTVTASSPSVTYGTASAPAITPSYSGFVNGDSSSSLTTQPTCSASTCTAHEPGGGSSSYQLRGRGGQQLLDQLCGWKLDGEQGDADDHDGAFGERDHLSADTGFLDPDGWRWLARRWHVYLYHDEHPAGRRHGLTERDLHSDGHSGLQHRDGFSQLAGEQGHADDHDGAFGERNHLSADAGFLDPDGRRRLARRRHVYLYHVEHPAGRGTASQSVTYTPTDTADYNTATGSVSVLVNKGAPTITTEPSASAITYPQTLASSTLTGGVGSPAGGTFTFTTSSTQPGAGTASQSVTYTPTDTADYNTATGSVSVLVNKGAPTITTEPSAMRITIPQASYLPNLVLLSAV